MYRKEISMTREMLRHKLPYGGAVNLHGEIVWCVTDEEHEAMLKHLRDIFDEEEDSL